MVSIQIKKKIEVQKMNEKLQLIKTQTDQLEQAVESQNWEDVITIQQQQDQSIRELFLHLDDSQKTALLYQTLSDINQRNESLTASIMLKQKEVKLALIKIKQGKNATMAYCQHEK